MFLMPSSLVTVKKRERGRGMMALAKLWGGLFTPEIDNCACVKVYMRIDSVNFHEQGGVDAPEGLCSHPN